MNATVATQPYDVTRLFNEGMMYVPVNESLVAEASAAVASVIDILAPQWERWSLTREGERGPDIGMVHRPGGTSDLKFFFHYADDLEVYLKAAGLSVKSIYPQLRAIKLLHTHINQLTLAIVRKIDGGLFLKVPLAENVNQCAKVSRPYTTPTLRGLLYPADIKQTGAKPHIDRSFITMHLGDEGGDLWALQGPEDTNGRVISPQKGEALVFFGVKVLHVSNGEYQPLWHASTVEEGQARKALVQFIHCSVGFPVSSALVAQKAFEQTHR